MLKKSSCFAPWQPNLDYVPLLCTGNGESTMQCYLSSHVLPKTLGVHFHGTVSICHEYLQSLHLSQASTFLSSLCGSHCCPRTKGWGKRGRL